MNCAPFIVLHFKLCNRIFSPLPTAFTRSSIISFPKRKKSPLDKKARTSLIWTGRPWWSGHIMPQRFFKWPHRLENKLVLGLLFSLLLLLFFSKHFNSQFVLKCETLHKWRQFSKCSQPSKLKHHSLLVAAVAFAKNKKQRTTNFS